MTLKNMRMTIILAMLMSWAIVFVVLAVIPKHVPTIVFVLLGIFAILDFLIVPLIIYRKPKQCDQTSAGAMQADGKLYSDSFIYIDDNGITIRLYYFPFGSKRVNFSDIEKVQAFNYGCPRLWGGDFRTWFGLDWKRMIRSMTFIIKQRNKWSQVGFTCKDSERVANILRSKTTLEIQRG